MKEQIILAFRIVLRDRYLTVLLGSFLFLCLCLLIFVSLSIRPSELQVVIHYTSFGTTNFYRDKWYYLLLFAGFVVIMAISHSLLTYKIHQLKGREFAVAFAWLGFIVLGISVALFYQVLKIASLS